MYKPFMIVLVGWLLAGYTVNVVITDEIGRPYQACGCDFPGDAFSEPIEEAPDRCIEYVRHGICPQ